MIRPECDGIGVVRESGRELDRVGCLYCWATGDVPMNGKLNLFASAVIMGCTPVPFISFFATGNYWYALLFAVDILFWAANLLVFWIANEPHLMPPPEETPE